MTEVTTFHRYRLIRRIARGGMAEVYLALHRGAAGFERPVALKKILPVYVGMEEFAQLFRDEARISAALDHSGIVQVHDFGVHDGEYYIVMEYVDGPDLEEVLDRCRRRGILPPVEVVLHLGHRLASALEYAHSRRRGGAPLSIIHRDVSPPNVLIGVTGEVKLTDFGVAKAALREALTRPGVLRGKYAYMSPEQVSHRDMDLRSDIFSLGTLLYETLTCINPFEGATDYQTMESVETARIEPAGFLRPDTPAELDRILLTCLQLDPADRYEEAGALRRDLSSLILDYQRADEPSCLVDFLSDVFPERAGSPADGSERPIVPAWDNLAHRLAPLLVEIPDRLPGATRNPIRLVPRPAVSPTDETSTQTNDSVWAVVPEVMRPDGTSGSIDLSDASLDDLDDPTPDPPLEAAQLHEQAPAPPSDRDLAETDPDLAPVTGPSIGPFDETPLPAGPPMDGRPREDGGTSVPEGGLGPNDETPLPAQNTFREIGPRAKGRPTSEWMDEDDEQDQIRTEPQAIVPSLGGAPPRPSASRVLGPQVVIDAPSAPMPLDPGFLPPLDELSDPGSTEHEVPLLGAPTAEFIPSLEALPTPPQGSLEDEDPLITSLTMVPPMTDDGVPILNEWDLPDEAFEGPPIAESTADAPAPFFNADRSLSDDLDGDSEDTLDADDTLGDELEPVDEPEDEPEATPEPEPEPEEPSEEPEQEPEEQDDEPEDLWRSLPEPEEEQPPPPPKERRDYASVLWIVLAILAPIALLTVGQDIKENRENALVADPVVEPAPVEPETPEPTRREAIEPAGVPEEPATTNERSESPWSEPAP